MQWAATGWSDVQILKVRMCVKILSKSIRNRISDKRPPWLTVTWTLCFALKLWTEPGENRKSDTAGLQKNSLLIIFVHCESSTKLFCLLSCVHTSIETHDLIIRSCWWLISNQFFKTAVFSTTVYWTDAVNEPMNILRHGKRFQITRSY